MTRAEKPVGVAVLGLGNVGSQVVRIIEDSAPDLAARIGAPLQLRGIGVRRVGADRGVPVELLTSDIDALVSRDDVDIVVELMGPVEPAHKAILGALERGKSVVTANKALLAQSTGELAQAAERAHVDLYFEAAVAGAIPVIRPLTQSLAGDTVVRVAGIVNGTTNYILSEMDSTGADYTTALADAGAPRRPRAAALRTVASTSGALLVRTAALRAALLAATVVAARIGTVALAAYQVGFGVLGFLALALDAFAIAAQALVGRYLGAGATASARGAARRMVTLAICSGVVLAVALGLVRYPVAELFSNDPAVVSAAAMSLLVVAALQPLNAYVFVLDGVLIGAGDHRFLAWAGILVNVVVFVPAVLAVVPLGAGLAGLWAAIALLEAGRAVANGWRYHGGRWTTVGLSAPV